MKLTEYTYRGYKKKTQAFENNLLLEFQWPITNLHVKSAKYSDRLHALY